MRVTTDLDLSAITERYHTRRLTDAAVVTGLEKVGAGSREPAPGWGGGGFLVQLQPVVAPQFMHL
jgi:hypothetical protein